MSKPSPPVLEARALGCARDGRVLFEDLSFSVQPGQLWLIRGPNGSGKTSLLRMLAGLAPIERGDLVWAAGATPALWVGHLTAIKPYETACENLEHLATLEGDAPQDWEAALAAVGMRRFCDVCADRLSAGQARRIALARLAFSARKLWLLDEPLTSLDADSVQWFESCLAAQLQRGGSVVMATHRGISDALPAQTLRLGS